MGYNYKPLYMAANLKLSIDLKTTALLKVSLVGGLLKIGLSLIFIPFYGIYAAAISTFVALLYLAVSGFYFKEFRANNTEKYHPLIWLMLLILLTAFLYLIRDLYWPIKAAISLVIPIIMLMSYIKYKHEIDNHLNY